MSDLNKQIVDVIQAQLPAQTAGVLKAYLEETHIFVEHKI